MNRALKWKIRNLLIVLAMTVTVTCYGQDAGDISDPASNPIARQIDDNAASLTKQLRETAFWTHPEHRADLLAALTVAGRICDESLVPILLPHISFDPDPARNRHRQLTLVQRLPVIGTLKEIGLRAVPLLIAFVESSIINTDGSLNHDAVLAVYAIREIYDVAGAGTKMTQTRLEIELTLTKENRSISNLKAALDLPLFKADLPAKPENGEHGGNGAPPATKP
ncbi:MAG: hypothetical protein ACREP2_13265 [Rhodanobacteraceae bacterium]